MKTVHAIAKKPGIVAARLEVKGNAIHLDNRGVHGSDVREAVLTSMLALTRATRADVRATFKEWQVVTMINSDEGAVLGVMHEAGAPIVKSLNRMMRGIMFPRQRKETEDGSESTG